MRRSCILLAATVAVGCIHEGPVLVRAPSDNVTRNQDAVEDVAGVHLTVSGDGKATRPT